MEFYNKTEAYIRTSPCTGLHGLICSIACLCRNGHSKVM